MKRRAFITLLGGCGSGLAARGRRAATAKDAACWLCRYAASRGPNIMRISSSGWPNLAIRKAGISHSTISKHRTSKAPKEAIASSRRATLTCFWQSGTSALYVRRYWLPRGSQSHFWLSISTPWRGGYVASLSQPGGNVTGIFVRQVELAAKRIEIAREAFPSATVVGNRI